MLFPSKQPGNVIAVRACAQFEGWENYAESGYLVIRVSNTSEFPHTFRVLQSLMAAQILLIERPASGIIIPDVSHIARHEETIQAAILQFYKDISDEENVIFQSTAVQMLSNEIRADQVVQMMAPPPYEATLRPLRLLCLGKWNASNDFSCII